MNVRTIALLVLLINLSACSSRKVFTINCFSCDNCQSVFNKLLPDNSVLELTNGSCNLTHSLNFNQVSNITIRGQGSQYTHISCHHMNAGLVFNESSNIELKCSHLDTGAGCVSPASIYCSVYYCFCLSQC